MIRSRPAVVCIWIVHPDVVVAKLLLRLLWLLRLGRMWHEGVSLAGQGLALLVLYPLPLALPITRCPVGRGPECVHGPTLNWVIDEGDDGTQRNLQGNNQGQEPADAVGPFRVKDNSAVSGWDPVVDGDSKNDHQDDWDYCPTNLKSQFGKFSFWILVFSHLLRPIWSATQLLKEVCMKI